MSPCKPTNQHENDYGAITVEAIHTLYLPSSPLRQAGNATRGIEVPKGLNQVHRLLLRDTAHIQTSLLTKKLTAFPPHLVLLPGFAPLLCLLKFYLFFKLQLLQKILSRYPRLHIRILCCLSFHQGSMKARYTFCIPQF